jgi:putative ABC transport system permease protein
MSFFFHYDYFDEARAGAKGQVGWYTIRIKDPSRATEVAKLVDQEFENSDQETKTEPEGAFAQSWAKQVGNIALITAAILGAVFFTILLVAGNTISQAVRERTGELGVLKAIGFTNTQVLALVMAESCLISVIGGILGLGLACLIVPALAQALSTMLPMFFFPVRDLALGFGICIGLGIATGIFPALAAMRLRVADALRRM